MNEIKPPEAKSPLKKRNPQRYIYVLRNVSGTAVLAAGTMGYISDHLGNVSQETARLAAAVVVLLIIYFANSDKV